MPADTARVQLPQRLWQTVKRQAQDERRTSYGHLAILVEIGIRTVQRTVKEIQQTETARKESVSLGKFKLPR